MKTHTLYVSGIKKMVAINRSYCIGYTGRDIEQTKLHIKELAEIGITEPPEIPMLYPVRTSSLMHDGEMEILGQNTSGEAEIVLVIGDSEDEVYVTVGSDHTDRRLEEIDINLSKQICDKPFAQNVWNLSDIYPHWDELELSSEVMISGKWIAYQKDKISSILPYDKIIEYLKKSEIELKNSIFFSGTVPLLDGFKYGEGFRMKFVDPVLNNEISLEYKIKNIERSL